MSNSIQLAKHFTTIDKVLAKTRQYWQISPFEHTEFLWHDNASLCHFLTQLQPAEIEQLDSCDETLASVIGEQLGVRLNFGSPISDSALIGTQQTVSSHFKAGIKGRKWSQIEAFSAHVTPDSTPLLEWCAGKGHLGRLISYQQRRDVVSLEWQQELCEAGRVLADKHSIVQRFVHGDAFGDIGASLLHSDQHAIALHACGDLHVELIRQAAATKTQAVTFAPCCYHLINGECYQPLSQQARRSDLSLSKRDLALSMAQTVVATKREREHRETEVAWRLGFDLLQRDIRGVDSYLPLPSIKQSMLVGKFTEFCQWACQKKGLVMPSIEQVSGYEQLGWKRREINSRIELVTHAFRLLLEHWLLLDRALFLIEQGYEVNLQQFCPREVTPRNTLIDARR